MPRSQSRPQSAQCPSQYRSDPSFSYYASAKYVTPSPFVRQNSYTQIRSESYESTTSQVYYPQLRAEHYGDSKPQKHRSLDELREEAKGRGIVHSYETSYEYLDFMLDSSYTRQRMMADRAEEQHMSPIAYPHKPMNPRAIRQPSFGLPSASLSSSIRASTFQMMRPPPVPQIIAVRPSLSQFPLPPSQCHAAVSP